MEHRLFVILMFLTITNNAVLLGSRVPHKIVIERDFLESLRESDIVNISTIKRVNENPIQVKKFGYTVVQIKPIPFYSDDQKIIDVSVQPIKSEILEQIQPLIGSPFPVFQNFPYPSNILINPTFPDHSNVPVENEYENHEDYYMDDSSGINTTPENKLEIPSMTLGVQIISSNVTLDGNLTEDFFEQIFYDVEFLSIKSPGSKGGSLKYIGENAFRKLPNLLELEIIHHAIMEMSDGAFEGNVNLRSLNFEDNQIQNFQENWFQNLFVLEVLNFSNNQIEEIHKKSFKDLWKLKVLNLSRNRLKYLDQILFQSTVEILKIDLSDNEISRIEDYTFFYTKKLADLNLSKNQLAAITRNAFHGTFLSILNLSENSIKSIEPESFYMRAGFINLSFNRLENLDANWFDGKFYSSINLSHNEIPEIPGNFFEKLQIEMLDLSFNEIEEIFWDFLDVNWVYLESNRIRWISDGAFEKLRCSWGSIDLRNNTCFNAVLDHERLAEEFGNSLVELRFEECENMTLSLRLYNFHEVDYPTLLDLPKCRRNKILENSNNRRFDGCPNFLGQLEKAVSKATKFEKLPIFVIILIILQTKLLQ